MARSPIDQTTELVRSLHVLIDTHPVAAVAIVGYVVVAFVVWSLT